MTTSKYYKDNQATKAAKNAERVTVILEDGVRKRVYVSHPLHPENPRRLAADFDRREDAAWHSAEIDEIIRLARHRYIAADESYERVRCGYVYQVRQRNVFWVSKVGFSGDPEQRIKAANTFLMPHEEFVIVKVWPCRDKYVAEACVHARLADRRVGTKELFHGYYSDVTTLIDDALVNYDRRAADADRLRVQSGPARG